MPSSLSERTPLKQDLKQQHQQEPSFLTVRWVVILCVGCLGLAILGYFGHKRQQDRSVIVRRPEEVSSAPTPPPSPAAEFLKCNPSVVASPESVEVSRGGAFLKSGKSPLADRRCGLKQASLIRGFLNDLKYDFKAVLNPSEVLPNLLGMDRQSLDQTLKRYEEVAKAKGKLGILLKLFAWGMPIHVQELWSVAGDDVAAALSQCNIMRECGSSPMSVSSIQFTPLVDTDIIVATDWLLPKNTSMLVGPVDSSAQFFADNIPSKVGHRPVLDMNSNSGVLGLMAAYRGATNVTIMQPTLRAVKFAQFSVWLSKMEYAVRVAGVSAELLDQVYKTDSGNIHLLLGQSRGTQAEQDATITRLVEASRQLLTSKGALVMGFQGQGCAKFEAQYHSGFCRQLVLENGQPAAEAKFLDELTGNIVCRSRVPIDPSAGSPEQDISRSEAVFPSQEGIVYAWRNPVNSPDVTKESLVDQKAEPAHVCAALPTTHISLLNGPEGQRRACEHSRPTMNCPLPTGALDAVLNSD